MTLTNGSTNAQIAQVLAGSLDETHLGKHIAFYDTDGKRKFGCLEAVYRPRQGIRTLTLSSGRVRDVTSSTEIDVITQGAS